MAQLVERRTSAERNSDTLPETGTQRPVESEDGLVRIRAVEYRERGLRFNNLYHHLTVELLYQAYYALERHAAAGVVGVDWYHYGEALDSHLTALHQHLHKGRYRAQPVKRGCIDKAGGRRRPLGITCVEDKIVQQAVMWVLESIYEVDFLGFSYGSRDYNYKGYPYCLGIENRLHWVRDVTFDEDHCQVRKGFGSQVLAAMRNFIIGLLRLSGAAAKRSIASLLRHFAAKPGQAIELILGR